MTGRVLHQPAVTETSLVDFGQAARPVAWAVSNDALLDWALAPAEALESLTLRRACDPPSQA